MIKLFGKSGLISVFKATLPVALVVSMLSGILTTNIALCSNRAEQLGSALAVGSPVLNQNFSEDSWNAYEMECLGVYLSNFVEPLSETYENAFTGEGHGLYALRMSSRNDPVNNRVLRGLLDVAIDTQFTKLSPLYIGEWKYENGALDSTIVVNGDEGTRVVATLGSLYMYGYTEITAEGEIGGVDESGLSNNLSREDYYFHGSIGDTPLVFYKEVEGGKKLCLIPRTVLTATRFVQYLRMSSIVIMVRCFGRVSMQTKIHLCM